MNKSIFIICFFCCFTLVNGRGISVLGSNEYNIYLSPLTINHSIYNDTTFLCLNTGFSMGYQFDSSLGLYLDIKFYSKDNKSYENTQMFKYSFLLSYLFQSHNCFWDHHLHISSVNGFIENQAINSILTIGYDTFFSFNIINNFDLLKLVFSSGIMYIPKDKRLTASFDIGFGITNAIILKFDVSSLLFKKSYYDNFIGQIIR